MAPNAPRAQKKNAVPDSRATSAHPDLDERKDTKDEIIQASLQLLLERGYGGASMKAIAAEVGITTPALYWHFPSKQAIFLAALEQGLNEFLAFVNTHVNAENPRERFAQFVRTHTVYQLEHASVASVYQAVFKLQTMIDEVPVSYHRRLDKAQRKYSEQLRDILEAGRANGDFHFDDITVTTRAVMQFCEYPNSWFDPDGQLSVAEVGDLYVRLALRMVGATVSP